MLLAKGRQPTATLSWLLTVILFPIGGFLLYLLIGKTRARRRSKRLARVEAYVHSILRRHGVLERARAEESARDPRIDSLLRLGERVATVPATRDNRVDLLVDGEAAYGAMEQAALAAKDHVHAEFYIIKDDAIGTRMRDVLAAKAAEGVEVRVLCDALGSIELPRDFWRPLVEAGGEASVYEPVWRVMRLLRGLHRVDFRNHRKIVVVDGRVGFTGGINVGKEYLGADPSLGSWRDSHVRIEGPAVLALQKVFAEDWLVATGVVMDAGHYFPGSGNGAGTALVQIVDSGPDRAWSPNKHFLCQAIGLARERVWITNPYFIPAPPVEAALEAAALRGVDVRLLLPGRSDNLLVRLASATYYAPLLEAGVRIFHFDLGFVHSKTLLVDDWAGSVGSTNLDNRSLQLNFEVDAFVYDAAFVEALARSFCADLERSREVSLHETEASLPKRVACAAARLLSPLL